MNQCLYSLSSRWTAALTFSYTSLWAGGSRQQVRGDFFILCNQKLIEFLKTKHFISSNISQKCWLRFSVKFQKWNSSSRARNTIELPPQDASLMEMRSTLVSQFFNLHCHLQILQQLFSTATWVNECEQICLHKNFQRKLGDSSSSMSPFYCVVEETNGNKWENPEETELELQLRSYLDSNKSGPAVNDPELDLALGHPIPTNSFF